MNIQKDLLNILKNNGNAILYQINNQKITYSECYSLVVKTSNNLLKQGTSPVILYGHKSIEQFVSILSCLVAGRTYIPIDLCTPVTRIKEIISSSKASLVIKNEPITIDDIPCLTLDEVNNNNFNLSSNNSINNEIAYIIYTSGSTGKSKGVPISYKNLSHFTNWIINLKEHQNCQNINILSQASFSFDLTLMDIYFSIFTKSHITAIDGDTKEDINAIYNILSLNKLNYLIMTPTFIKMLLIDISFNEKNYPNIKYMFFCGEVLEVETARKIKERFPHIIIINAYGPTEATCCVCLNTIEDSMLSKSSLPVGKISTAATPIEIANNEIILKGDSVFSGYLDLDSPNYYQENNINTYKTGDIGYIENDYLYCNGRLDSQIKYQGYRIELSDIENNLLKIEGIKEACVIAKFKTDSNIVRLIKAFVTTSKEITELDIKQELIKLLPRYMIPKTIVILDKMPINENGKYDRKKLKEL